MSEVRFEQFIHGKFVGTDRIAEISSKLFKGKHITHDEIAELVLLEKASIRKEYEEALELILKAADNEFIDRSRVIKKILKKFIDTGE